MWLGLTTVYEYLQDKLIQCTVVTMTNETALLAFSQNRRCKFCLTKYNAFCIYLAPKMLFDNLRPSLWLNYFAVYFRVKTTSQTCHTYATRRPLYYRRQNLRMWGIKFKPVEERTTMTCDDKGAAAEQDRQTDRRTQGHTCSRLQHKRKRREYILICGVDGFVHGSFNVSRVSSMYSNWRVIDILSVTSVVYPPATVLAPLRH